VHDGTDEFAFTATENKVYGHDLHATLCFTSSGSIARSLPTVTLAAISA